MAESSLQDWWSLKPIQKPSLPQENELCKDEIDRFVVAKLETNGMRLSPAADKRTLIRRLYYDLIGLPPTPEQVKNYIDDNSSDAYEKIVNQLLESPRYGERWARHWLDIVHYAETHGHDQDRIRTNAWPYRDYVIASFNSDKPYSKFVQEQIAGDTLFPNDPQAVVAMGFLATGPWDESSLRDIREDSIDRQVARYIDRDDIVMTTMNTFVSTTAQCARCHDHKFDPITQKGSYNLQAVFAGTDKANRIYDTDPAVHKKRQSLLLRQKQLRSTNDLILSELQSEVFNKRVAQWESKLETKTPQWDYLPPVECISINGSTAQIKEDRSILFGGLRPETDTYLVRSPGPA